MAFVIVDLKPADAEERLQYTKCIGSESDNLSFGAEGLSHSIEEERRYIQSVCDSKNSIHLIAKSHSKIIGECKVIGLPRRFSHRGELGITVIKNYWNKGIGSALLNKALDIAKNELRLEVISLEVRSDNKAAIHLYEKIGFQHMGTYKKYFKVHEKYFDADFMNLYF